MDPAPHEIGGARVLAFTPIDVRHRPTGACRHTVAGALFGPASGLAICRYAGEEGFYLFYCDARWREVTDTWHATIEDAQEQAESEYEGTKRTWQHHD